MRILLINQYYHPDIAATAQLCTDLAEDLCRDGHRVTVVAGTARYRTPHEGERPLPGERLPLREEHRGVRIVRVPVLAPAEGGRAGRLELLGKALGYACFLSGALYRVLTEERPDVVLCLSTPPLVAALGLCTKALRGARFVYWVQDVYPELAVELGVMAPGGALARTFSALSRALYHRADAIVALDEAMAERLAGAGAPRERVRVIDNWCDSTEVRPLPPEQNRLRAQLGLGAGFAVGYAGNMGRGHDFDTVAAAMPLLRYEPISWLFIGGGPQREALQAQVRAHDLRAVHFLPPQARSGIREALTAGDVGLVTLDADLAGLLVPSKLYGMLAAGRPILYIGPGTGRVAELVRGEGLGEVVENGDVAGLCTAVRRLAADPEGRQRMGARARAVLERGFSRTLATARHAQVLREVVLGPDHAQDPLVPPLPLAGEGRGEGEEVDFRPSPYPSPASALVDRGDPAGAPAAIPAGRKAGAAGGRS